MRHLRVMSAALAAASLVSCSGGDGSDRTSAISAVLGNDFTGNYARIHGIRSVPADGKYPCLDEFDVCLGLDPAGATAAIPDLCPSDDTPPGTWSFTYVLYADAQCTTALANLGCMPTQGEWLTPGHNNNDVVCTTRNADKTWDFCVMDPVTGAGSEACPVCVPPDPRTCNPTTGPGAPVVGTQTVYHLTNSNVAQLQGIDIQVTQQVTAGNLVLSLCDAHNSLSNAMLGVDLFYYGAASPPYSVLSVSEAGWSLNTDGTQADGFGSFGSHKNANSAGQGGVSCANPLVFTLSGDPTQGANTPLDLALHARFDDSCSGWISNRTAAAVGSDANCHRLPDCVPCLTQ
ncbi:MAG TPA: hypothetical protein VFU23_00345 [Gemmatimonadales bacterium]|nr:hypothetical protein [Gemmatimonadales bacterium]